jgi:hypothetical protein
MKAVFIDWGNKETEIITFDLSEGRWFQTAYWGRRKKFTGKWTEQIDEIVDYILEIKPDKVISDRVGLGESASQELAKRLGLS